MVYTVATNKCGSFHTYQESPHPQEKKNNNNNMDGLWRFNITRTQFCLSLLLPAIKHGNGKSPFQFAGFPIEMQIYSGFLIQPCLMTPETYPHKIPMIPSMFHDEVLSDPSFSCPKLFSLRPRFAVLFGAEMIIKLIAFGLVPWTQKGRQRG